MKQEMNSGPNRPEASEELPSTEDPRMAVTPPYEPGEYLTISEVPYAGEIRTGDPTRTVQLDRVPFKIACEAWMAGYRSKSTDPIPLSDGAIEFLYACTGVHTTMSDNADSEDVDAARDWLSDLLWKRRNGAKS